MTLMVFGRVEVRPFFVEPREDQIFFKTGSHAVEASEKGNLGETLEWIRQGISAAKNQAGVALGMRLYVGGYTDTVGSSESNRKLSRQRAKSIASYFKKQGIKIVFTTRIWRGCARSLDSR